MMVTTTSTSTSVKPRVREQRLRDKCPHSPLAAGLPVGTETEDVDLAARAGIEVLVLAAPRILGTRSR